jgi:5-methylcytosine-specific restriction endonuclease McrA
MTNYSNRTFRKLFDDGGTVFQDIVLESCTFDWCGLSLTKSVERRSTVRNVRLTNCTSTNHCGIGPAVFEKQRDRILQANKDRHGGMLISDDIADPNRELIEKAPRSGAGTRRKLAVVDHIKPFTKGGSNSYCNARVISQQQNSRKGNRENGE